MPEESLKMHPAPLLALVVPCYNEQEILPATMQTLSRMLEGSNLEFAGRKAY